MMMKPYGLVLAGCATTALSCAGNLPIHATILGTDSKDGSTELTLMGSEATRIVDMIGVSDSRYKDGRMDPVALSTEPNSDGAVHVNVHERTRGAIGPQWRSSVAISAFVAASTLNKDLLDFVFTAEAAADLEGPSGSGLMTAAFLAAMTGAQLDKSVTMTGTINPDGTIGPVGGIPEKFLAAIGKGKRTLGYPVGMHLARSAATNEMVDIVKLATDHGAKAVEIADVHQAYHLMTGNDLPAVVPVSEEEMQLDAATVASLDKLSLARQQAMEVMQLDADPARPAELERLVAMVRHQLAESSRLHDKGMAAPAHDAMDLAWEYALAASTLHTVVTRAQAGDLAGAIATLDGLARLGGDDGDVFKRIAAHPAVTLGDQLQISHAYRAALRGWTGGVSVGPRLAKAKAFLGGLDIARLTGAEQAAWIANGVVSAIRSLSARAAQYALAGDWLELDTGHRAADTAVATPQIVRASSSFQAASAAGIAYFDSLVIPGFAKSLKVSESDAKETLAEREPTYLFAHLADHFPSEHLAAELEQAWGEHSVPWLLLSLASSELGYFDSTYLVAKYYSLGVAGGRVVHEQAFVQMLAGAERTARASARAARIATGAIPMEAKLAYQLAVASRDGSTADKLAALESFWASSSYSRTAVMLARK